MKMVKSLLLGTAAGLVAMSGAQAADLPVKAKPVQIVKIVSISNPSLMVPTEPIVTSGSALSVGQTVGLKENCSGAKVANKDVGVGPALGGGNGPNDNVNDIKVIKVFGAIDGRTKADRNHPS